MGAAAEKISPSKSRAFGTGNPLIQTSLKVGKPGDKYEVEADRVADQVMMMPAQPSSPILSASSGGLQMMPEEEEEVQMMPISSSFSMISLAGEEEEETLQLKEDSIQADGNGAQASPRLSAQIQSNAGGGSQMSPAVQAEMSSKIGADFSGVKIHTGPQASSMSNALGAQAFTYGNDIYFNDGKYQPESPDGKRLLAHELTHTVQQGSSQPRVSRKEITQTEPQVQRLPWAVREGLSRFASYIPGYTLLCVIIGYDPLAGRNVERNATNLIGGLLGLIPIFGTLLFNKLVELNIINDALAWVEAEMASLDLSVGRLERTLEQAWDEASVFSGWDENMAVLDRTFGQLFRDISTFAGRVRDKVFELVKAALMTALKALADAFLGYPLLVKLIGTDPLTGEEVNSTTAEKIEAFLLLIGKEQELERMRAEGTIERTAAWIDAELAALNFSFEEIKALFDQAWNAFSLEDLRDPVGAFTRTIGIFAPFTARVFTFAANVAIKVLEFIKDALLAQLSAYAREQQGYHLVTVILGKDPFTQEVVERSTENIIRGFMGLLPGGEEQFQQMKKTGAIQQAVVRIDAAVATLNFSWAYITGLFLDLWNSFTIADVFNPFAAFVRIVETLASPIRRLFDFVVTIVQIIVEILLVVMNFPIDTINQIIANARSAFEDIKRDPIGFIKNLLRAVKQGFVQFFENILTHLLGGLRDWLFGELASAGINPPADLSFQSILGFVLDVLGLTMDNVWERLALKIGQERVDQIRNAIDTLTGIWTFIKDVWERGPIAIWEYVQEQLSNLWNMVLEQIQNWVVTRIVQQVTTRLLSMLDPTGIMAVVNSFIAFYRAVQSFIEKLREMLEIVNSFVAGVANIARGSVGEAANYLESALARAVPVAIGFLANQVGLRGLGTRIAEMIGGLRDRVNAAIDWLIDRALAVGGAILNAGRNAVAAVVNWTRNLLGVEQRFEGGDGNQHRIYFQSNAGEMVIMINPAPASPLIAWLNNLNFSNSADNAKKAEALQVANQIETKKAETINETDPNRQAAAEEQKTREIRRLVDELSRKLGPLFSSVLEECASESNGKLAFGSLTGPYGTSMEATYLSNKNAPHGSRPSVDHPRYDLINRRKRGRGAYYIKGHLLNERLGGTGANWKNLTPLTRRANSEHERFAESRVKTAVNAGNMVYYKVEAQYGRTLQTDPDPIINSIKSGEVDIPNRLVCKAELITPAAISRSGREERTTLIPDGTVINNDISSDPYEV
ncbi:eCIS core domain-containing protein [Algoriphagus mannitolivorans]|uniref:eCIS core domain-containing protein n=1 Tax=Algoriphagus mannitolivorans TaxID=226504 RepID=UPI00040F532D|nr:DUF4157 domain-containing protein [Algoriphagus mannitolivorans]